MKIITKLETKILVLLGSILFIGIWGSINLFDKYIYIIAAHFVETCKQIVYSKFLLTEHTNGVIAIGIPIFSVLLFTLYILVSYSKTKRKINKLKTNIVSDIPSNVKAVIDALGIDETSITIVKHPKPLAVTYGLYKQQILISDWIINSLDAKEIEAILLHEQYHMKNKHLLIYLLGQIAAYTLFYIPVVSGLVKTIKFKLESEADKYTQQKQNTSKYIKSALIKSLLGDVSFSLLPNFSGNLYEDRLESLDSKGSLLFISKKQIAMTIISLATISTLYLFPTTTHAEIITTSEAGICTNTNDCGAHCTHELQQNFTPMQLQSFVKN